MTDPLEQEAREALRLNQTTLLLVVFTMLEECTTLDEAKKRILSLLTTLSE